jgi:hypothetical protein
MSPAAFGLLVIAALPVLVILEVVALDAWIIATGRQSISRYTLDLSRRYPIVGVAIGLIYGFVAGFLVAHLWFTQYIVSGDTL